MNQEITRLETESTRAHQETKRLRAALAEAWGANDLDLIDQLRAEQTAASSRRKAVNIRLREIVDTSDIVLTSSQISTACDLLGWTIETLADYSKITAHTLERAARDGTAHMQPIKMVGVRRTLESAGVEFIGGAGVRLRKGATP